MAAGQRQRQRDETRQRLLAAARQVLAREGLAGTTSRKVAEEAGVAIGTLFVHFSRVEQLVAALLDEHLAAAVPAALRAAARKAGLVRQLTHAARALFESYDAEPDLARAWLAASLFGPSEDARLAQFAAWVGERLSAAIAAGEVDPVDPELAFQVYFSLYFTALVAGLRGALTRAQQVRFIERALARFLLLEKGHSS
ncbi:MAG TPA: TetR/AcrR family transcriptional regulator [Polyangiaceae bacterium]|nr:TetR/AcrR family transcriptional regulator [Polyangiaceae bacterium]